MLFDNVEEPESEEDIRLTRSIAASDVSLWKTRALVAGAAWLVLCAAVVPFMKGHAWHNHWEPYGHYLVNFVMAVFTPLVICAGNFITHWFAYRRLLKE